MPTESDSLKDRFDRDLYEVPGPPDANLKAHVWKMLNLTLDTADETNGLVTLAGHQLEEIADNFITFVEEEKKKTELALEFKIYNEISVLDGVKIKGKALKIVDGYNRQTRDELKEQE